MKSTSRARADPGSPACTMRAQSWPPMIDLSLLPTTIGHRGGGGFAQIADADLLCAQATPVRRILATHLGTLQIWQPRGPGPWRFAPLPDTSVSIEAETRAIALVKAGQAPPGVRVGKRAGPGRVWLHLHL